jgi:chromosome segregation ATPase|tara:strand:+ start:3896 stop:4387 length:492 start_codon:yes stop_codon:yes gene_type:complete
MSDIINELQGSFEDTNKQLSKLSSDLSKLTKFEDNLSKAGESLEDASEALRKTSENHSDFIDKAKQLNSSIEVIAKTVGKLEPGKIIKAQNDQKDKLDEIESHLNKEIETLKTEINTLKESNAKSLDEIMSKATSASRIRLLNLLVLIGVAGLLFLSVAPKFL